MLRSLFAYSGSGSTRGGRGEGREREGGGRVGAPSAQAEGRRRRMKSRGTGRERMGDENQPQRAGLIADCNIRRLAEIWIWRGNPAHLARVSRFMPRKMLFVRTTTRPSVINADSDLTSILNRYIAANNARPITLPIKLFN
jgi:hypothetical protein